MEAFNIDLTVFEPKYRQALLFAMIEGLIEGASFTFKDNRKAQDIESELIAAHLNDYRWERRQFESAGEVTYFVEKKPTKAQAESCCGFCRSTGEK
jgi:uncharacterized protein (DUF2249 family)